MAFGKFGSWAGLAMQERPTPNPQLAYQNALKNVNLTGFASIPPPPQPVTYPILDPAGPVTDAGAAYAEALSNINTTGWAKIPAGAKPYSPEVIDLVENYPGPQDIREISLPNSTTPISLNPAADIREAPPSILPGQQQIERIEPVQQQQQPQPQPQAADWNNYNMSMYPQFADILQRLQKRTW